MFKLKPIQTILGTPLASGYVPRRSIWQRLHLDGLLLLGLILLSLVGLAVLYSAANENLHMVISQVGHFVVAFALLIVVAQIPPTQLRRFVPIFFAMTMLLLIAVLIMGHIGKGAQRWLDFGLLRFQPSEIAKLAVPAMLAYYFSDKKLPPKGNALMMAGLLVFIPVILTAKQPDLGTAVVIAFCGAGVILLAGLSWRWLIGLFSISILTLPFLWHFMRDYQRQRVLTFFNPERDPLGSGYHIIQSKIAIGSGGLWGKGWLQGTQSHLHFLPEHTTDFIFAVIGEEFGLMGTSLLILLCLFIIARCLYIAANAQDTFCRLLAGSLALNFFIAAFINMGMVAGILPVVGVPLPLVSYGGTSLIISVMSFGILMSIQTHRKLLVST